MIFILLLLCSKVNLCVCKNGAFTQIVLLTGSNFEMQHGSHSSVFQLLKEKNSRRFQNWIQTWRHELEPVACRVKA